MFSILFVQNLSTFFQCTDSIPNWWKREMSLLLAFQRLYIKLLQEKKTQNTNLLPSKKNLKQGMPSGMTASDTGYCNPMSISFPFQDHSSNGGDPLALGTEGVTIQIPRDETWVLYANYSNFFPLKKWLVFWMWLLRNLCFCNSDIVSWDAAVTLWMQKVERTA